MFDIRSYVSDRPGKTEVGSVRIPYFFKNDITKYKQNRVIIEKKMNDIIEQMGILDISDEIYNSLIDSFDETSTILKQNKVRSVRLPLKGIWLEVALLFISKGVTVR